MLHPKWFKTLDSKTRVPHISPVLFISGHFSPPTLCCSYSGLLPLLQKGFVFFSFFAQKVSSCHVSIHPSTHTCSVVMFAKTRPWIRSRMLNQIDTVLTLHSFLHGPFLFIHLDSFLLLFLLWDHSQYPQEDVFTMLIHHFISIIAFNFFIHQDIYCLLCAESILKLGIL